MDIAGYDNVFFTDSDPLDTLDRFSRSLLARWPKCVVEKDDNNEVLDIYDFLKTVRPAERIAIFFFRDKIMSEWWRTSDEDLMEDGTGVLSLRIREKKRLLIKVNVRKEISPPSNVEEYESMICGNGMSQITLITPTDPVSCKFSRWALDTAVAACFRT